MDKVSIQRAYAGQPFDAAKKRAEILKRQQMRVIRKLRETGAVPMTSDVTVALPDPVSIGEMFANIDSEINRAVLTEGPRFLDRHSSSTGSSYRANRFNHFANVEGIREYAYDDSTGRRVNGKARGNVTVGIGFNMDRPGARETWKQVFGDSVSFDDVYNGKVPLTRPQIQALFDHDIQYFEGVVSKAAGNRVLRENERLALLSVAYSAPERVASWSDIIQSGDDDALRYKILYESYDPNHKLKEGLKSRRYMEASLFSTVSETPNYLPDFGEYRQAVSGRKVSMAEFKSRHYSWQDFRNDRFKDAVIDEGLVNLLDNVTDQFGKGKLRLTSGYRSPEYNQKASFSGKSGPHTHGYAADIDVSGYSDEEKEQLIALLVANGARGIGHYDNGSIHVDLRPTKGKGPKGLALWYGQNKPYTQGHRWFSSGIEKGLGLTS